MSIENPKRPPESEPRKGETRREFLKTIGVIGVASLARKAEKFLDSSGKYGEKRRRQESLKDAAEVLREYGI